MGGTTNSKGGSSEKVGGGKRLRSDDGTSVETDSTTSSSGNSSNSQLAERIDKLIAVIGGGAMIPHGSKGRGKGGRESNYNSKKGVPKDVEGRLAQLEKVQQLMLPVLVHLDDDRRHTCMELNHIIKFTRGSLLPAHFAATHKNWQDKKPANDDADKDWVPHPDGAWKEAAWRSVWTHIQSIVTAAGNVKAEEGDGMTEDEKEEQAEVLGHLKALNDAPLRCLQRFYTLRLKEEADYSLWVLRIDHASKAGKETLTALMALTESGFADQMGMEVRQDHAPRAGLVKELVKHTKKKER
jgi:hypothetical protein